ncbi:hypothetical protein O181_045464 [Austropuccinia psidii MF-1]|uniref:Uncharacterized protein n=1 Tax=Austropuccinia psidii MF-1 TaxID=1389203 RepID=A0A9Q3HKE1_9BASI|nr:hypothetical protein [Austropuccinia psidii MF-1]
MVIFKNADGLSRLALAHTPENTAWVPQEEHHIEVIFVTDIGLEFFNQVKESYKMDKNCHILFRLLMKDFKDPSLSSKLDEIWKKAYDEGRFHLLDGILYHRTRHKCVMASTDRTLIETILHEFHDSVAAGHLSEDRTQERVKPALGGKIGRKMFQNTAKPVTDASKKTEPQKRNWECGSKYRNQNPLGK